jgi:hypothetical protein
MSTTTILLTAAAPLSLAGCLTWLMMRLDNAPRERRRRLIRHHLVVKAARVDQKETGASDAFMDRLREAGL